VDYSKRTPTLPAPARVIRLLLPASRLVLPRQSPRRIVLIRLRMRARLPALIPALLVRPLLCKAVPLALQPNLRLRVLQRRAWCLMLIVGFWVRRRLLLWGCYKIFLLGIHAERGKGHVICMRSRDAFFGVWVDFAF